MYDQSLVVFVPSSLVLPGRTRGDGTSTPAGRRGSRGFVVIVVQLEQLGLVGCIRHLHRRSCDGVSFDED